MKWIVEKGSLKNMNAPRSLCDLRYNIETGEIWCNPLRVGDDYYTVYDNPDIKAVNNIPAYYPVDFHHWTRSDLIDIVKKQIEFDESIEA